MKRFLDLICAGAGLIVLSPLIAALAVLIKLKMGSPIFFVQSRPGLDGRLFQVVKFRTMRAAFDRGGRPIPDEQRLTSFGKFLRGCSLDELPQLWNVLNGDMSLVGPRPLLPEYLPRYSESQRRRHEVKPGITGWAQINGRNSLKWEEKLALDTWYVDHQSSWLDLKILFLTILKVFRRKGIIHDGHATMPEFTGQKPTPHSQN